MLYRTCLSEHLHFVFKADFYQLCVCVVFSSSIYTEIMAACGVGSQKAEMVKGWVCCRVMHL